MIITCIILLVMLMPVAAFLLDGKDRGNVWLGVKYIVAFLIVAALFVVFLKLMGIWTVVLFPTALFVLLFARKQMKPK